MAGFKAGDRVQINKEFNAQNYFNTNDIKPDALLGAQGTIWDITYGAYVALRNLDTNFADQIVAMPHEIDLVSEANSNEVTKASELYAAAIALQKAKKHLEEAKEAWGASLMAADIAQVAFKDARTKYNQLALGITGCE